MSQPTMRDVAVRAGVGLGTVSRVVNGGASVRPETAEKVRIAIAELGFRRNEIARALRPGKNSAMIAVLLGDLTNPFYAAISKSAVEVARQAGFAVVVSMVDEDADAEERLVSDLLGRRVAGLMIVPDRGNHRFLRPSIEGGLPVVFIDRPAVGVEVDTVLLDNESGGWIATQHLAAQGHRRIAILIAPSYYTTGRRLRGYRRALREAGCPVDEGLVVHMAHGAADDAYLVTQQLLEGDDPPTAIFATTNFVCEGALRAIADAQASIAVVGFDDFRLADLLPLPASVVAGDVAEMGRRATELLLQRINGAEETPRREVLPVTLVARGSGEVPFPAKARDAAT